jgi:septal ring factor EnvC (AmiA/AmiB activator)
VLLDIGGEEGMMGIVTTDDLTMIIRKARSLYQVAEAAQRISTDLDETKANIKVADEIIDGSQKRLRRRKLTKRQRGKIERTMEYHQELLSSTEAECETKISDFSEAIAQVESTLRELAAIYDDLAKVPRFEHAERSSLLQQRGCH